MTTSESDSGVFVRSQTEPVLLTEDGYGPSPFFDPAAPKPSTILNEPIPGSEGGLIEAVKRAVTTALRESITKTGLSLDGTDSKVHISLEYPLEEEHYPGIWVQFSITQLTRAGLSHEVWTKDEDGSWMPIQEWMFNGRVTMNIVALSNKERDRISDALITMFAFSRTTDLIITQHKKDTRQFRSFLEYIDQSPYVSLTINTDALGLGGQSAQMGMLPWQQDVLVYEDTYTFDLQGYFNIVFRNDGWYELRRIDVVENRIDENTVITPQQWVGDPSHLDFGDPNRLANSHFPRSGYTR